MLRKCKTFQYNVRLYKNLEVYGGDVELLYQWRLTLPKPSLCRPYMAYVGMDKATVMMAADGKTSNHILLTKLSLLFTRESQKNNSTQIHPNERSNETKNSCFRGMPDGYFIFDSMKMWQVAILIKPFYSVQLSFGTMEILELRFHSILLFLILCIMFELSKHKAEFRNIIIV